MNDPAALRDMDLPEGFSLIYGGEERAARDLRVARKPAGETPRLSAVERARMRDEAALRKLNG